MRHCARAVSSSLSPPHPPRAAAAAAAYAEPLIPAQAPRVTTRGFGGRRQGMLTAGGDGVVARVEGCEEAALHLERTRIPASRNARSLHPPTHTARSTRDASCHRTLHAPHACGSRTTWRPRPCRPRAAWSARCTGCCGPPSRQAARHNGWIIARAQARTDLKKCPVVEISVVESCRCQLRKSQPNGQRRPPDHRTREAEK
jgi:hypothetical protein